MMMLIASLYVKLCGPQGNFVLPHSYLRFVDGKLAEEHAEYDMLSVLQQLGFQATPPAK